MESNSKITPSVAVRSRPASAPVDKLQALQTAAVGQEINYKRDGLLC